MSIWSTVDGTYLINKNVKFSFKKYVEELYDELFITYNQKNSGENINVTFQVRVNLDGMSAAKFVDSINLKLRQICIYQEVTATIRFG